MRRLSPTECGHWDGPPRPAEWRRTDAAATGKAARCDRPAPGRRRLRGSRRSLHTLRDPRRSEVIEKKGRDEPAVIRSVAMGRHVIQPGWPESNRECEIMALDPGRDPDGRQSVRSISRTPVPRGNGTRTGERFPEPHPRPGPPTDGLHRRVHKGVSRLGCQFLPLAKQFAAMVHTKRPG